MHICIMHICIIKNFYVNLKEKMETPFVFGKIASGKFFVDRTEELKRLSINFESGLNTMLISPRRWGKSSLVRKAGELVSKQNKNIKVCYVDAFAINTENEFYEVLALEVIKQSSKKWEDWLKTGKEFLKSLVPQFSVGVDPQSDFKIKIDLKDKESNYLELLNLPENIAIKRKLKFVICIDEFQKIGVLKDSLAIQQRFRSAWQHHQNVCYCLFGSKRHVISDMFQNQAMPFYRFGDAIYLPKIEVKHWLKYIMKSFQENGKTISQEMAEKIVSLVSNHPYYVQQLSHQVFINTTNNVEDSIIEKALSEIFNYYGIIYRKEVENLTQLQVNLLTAIVNGEKALNSKEVVKKYNLGTAGNILRTKQALENKEIIDFFEKESEFVDPFFKLWYKRYRN